MNTLFIIGIGLIGLLFPEWIILLSSRNLKIGWAHNIVCALAFAFVAAYFVK